MAIIKPIRGFRPSNELAPKVASRPYDVLNSKEARQEADGNPFSFLRIIKSEIDLPEDLSNYDPQVYQKAKDNFENFVKEETLVPDAAPHLYFYRQIMGDIRQTGIVCGSSIEDYFNDVVKKHEFTRPVKEKDRITHIATTGIHSGPVFMAYRANESIDQIVKEYTTHEAPEIDFTADDDIQHSIWVVRNEALIEKICSIFEKEVPATYIADGHHRAASTSKVGRKIGEENPDHTGEEAYNFFLSVLFPDNQLKIIDYNRVVKDLNGLSKEAFLEKLTASFELTTPGKEIQKPDTNNHFGMYLDGQWYALKMKEDLAAQEAGDPVASLDVALLQKHLFDPILGIVDQRTDDRIDFVGGIRGMGELEKRVDSGDVAVAFAIYPVSIQQLFEVADSGEVMPPKSTWFEPKLRSGLIVYKYV